MPDWVKQIVFPAALVMLAGAGMTAMILADRAASREAAALADAECTLRFRAARTVADSVAVLDRDLGWNGVGCRGTLRRAPSARKERP